MPLNNSTGGVSQVSSANADIAVATATSTPQLTLNSGTGADQIVKLDNEGKLPALDASQLTNISSTSDVAYLNQQQLIQNVDILRCLADASLAISDYNTMFCDIFSDTTGYDNTIDTGETTAEFSNDKYVNGGAGSDVVDASGLSLSNSGSVDYWGFKILANVTCLLKSLTKHASATPVDVGLATMNVGETQGTLVATATFVGNVATFSSPPTLTSGTRYFLYFGTAGGMWTRRYDTSVSFPINATNISYVSGGYTNGALELTDVNSVLINAVSITTAEVGVPTDTIVQTETIEVSGNLTAYQLYCKNATEGSGSVQYKISFDDGSSWSSAKELDTYYTNATTGTDIKIQLLLNGTGSGNIAEAEAYSLMVWY